MMKGTGLLALAALTCACGNDGPRWTKRADQIDVAAWKAVCGETHHTFDDPDTGDVPYREETFERPSPSHPLPKSPLVTCSFVHHLEGQGLLWAYLDVVGRPDEVSPELRQQLLALIEDILPASTHATLREVASSPNDPYTVKRVSHGFYFEGGVHVGEHAGGVTWSIRVSSRRPYGWPK